MTVQRFLAAMGTALCFAGATIASAADDSAEQLSDAVSSLEKTALPPLIASQNYLTVSKVYFQLAVARNRLHESAAACAALSQSLEYYRAALARDDFSVGDFVELAFYGRDDGEGLQAVRARLGCGATLASSH
jgi:7-keto-8-aminopelargonate synthetase-like enzyme